MRALHWFRNDLRLRDNTALDWAARTADELVCLFVFDETLLESERSSAKRVYFMLECLERLAKELETRGSRLVIARGMPESVIPELVHRSKIDVVTWNRDTSPYACRRDRRVSESLQRGAARVETFKDRVVFEADEILTGSGKPYSVYTPYRNAWLRRWHQDAPTRTGPMRFPKPIFRVRSLELPSSQSRHLGPRPSRLPTGGEAAAQRRLNRFLDRGIGHYAKARDVPALEGTSRLSPYLRFGVISVRECIEKAFERAHYEPRHAEGVQTWVNQLVWREFYHAVLATHPHVLERAYRSEYDRVEWEQNAAHFEAWCRGETGYPIVDAAMRQLAETGWMHNRLRMIVASFLTKDLLLDWRLGERFFMQQLVDGDPANNNGGWQWCASTGTDAQPYFRIFNPVSQGKRFDPDGSFTRRYLPELERVPTRHLQEPWESGMALAYPRPIVSHAERRVWAHERYERARQRARR